MKIEDIETYLNANTALKEALGIEGDCELGLSALGMGEHNLNFVFADPAGGSRYVLRVNVTKQPFHDDQVRYEYEALVALEPSCVTPLPLYVDSSDDAPGFGVLVESFCEGGMLDFDNLRPGDLQCAAQLMADIHATPIETDCPLHRPHDPLRALFEECRQRYALYEASDVAELRVEKWMDRFFACVEPLLDTPFDSQVDGHIVNTETLASHFLITPDEAAIAASHVGPGRFCAHPGYFVDWERPIIGDVAEDLAFFVAPTTTFWDSDYLFEPSRVDGFLDEYWQAVDGRFAYPGFADRFRVFRMVAVLRAFMWCCKAEAQYKANPDLHRTDRAVAKVPIYLSDEFLERMATEIFGL